MDKLYLFNQGYIKSRLLEKVCRMMVIYTDPGAIVPEPSVVYYDIYEAAKNNGHEYDWGDVT